MAPEVAYSMLLGFCNPCNFYTFSKSTQSILKVFQINSGDIGCIVVTTKDFARVWEALEKMASWFGGGG